MQNRFISYLWSLGKKVRLTPQKKNQRWSVACGRARGCRRVVEAWNGGFLVKVGQKINNSACAGVTKVRAAVPWFASQKILWHNVRLMMNFFAFNQSFQDFQPTLCWHARHEDGHGYDDCDDVRCTLQVCWQHCSCSVWSPMTSTPRWPVTLCTGWLRCTGRLHPWSQGIRSSCWNCVLLLL